MHANLRYLAAVAALSLFLATDAGAATRRPAAKPAAKPAATRPAAAPATAAAPAAPAAPAAASAPARPAANPAPAAPTLRPYERFEAYQPGRWVASASLGVGVNGFYGTGGSPLLGVSAEYGVNENFSVGGVLGHASSKDTYVVLGETFETKYGYTIIAARGSYHLTDLVDNERLDLYAGASLGYNKVSVTESARGYGDYVSVGASYMLYGVHAGARYWFNDKVAGFGELGFGLSELAAGVSVRL